MKIVNEIFTSKCQNQMLKHIIRMDKNCHITNFVRTFSHVEYA